MASIQSAAPATADTTSFDNTNSSASSENLQDAVHFLSNHSDFIDVQLDNIIVKANEKLNILSKEIALKENSVAGSFNVFIQATEPTVPCFWIDTSGGNIKLWIKS